MTFLDGTGVTPGAEECRCGKDCEFPCWQRIGIAGACEECGCPPLVEEMCDRPGKRGCGSCEGCERWLMAQERG